MQQSETLSLMGMPARRCGMPFATGDYPVSGLKTLSDSMNIFVALCERKAGMIIRGFIPA